MKKLVHADGLPDYQPLCRRKAASLCLGPIEAISPISFSSTIRISTTGFPFFLITISSPLVWICETICVARCFSSVTVTNRICLSRLCSFLLPSLYLLLYLLL